MSGDTKQFPDLDALHQAFESHLREMIREEIAAANPPPHFRVESIEAVQGEAVIASHVQINGRSDQQRGDTRADQKDSHHGRSHCGLCCPGPHLIGRPIGRSADCPRYTPRLLWKQADFLSRVVQNMRRRLVGGHVLHEPSPSSVGSTPSVGDGSGPGDELRAHTSGPDHRHSDETRQDGGSA